MIDTKGNAGDTRFHRDGVTVSRAPGRRVVNDLVLDAVHAQIP